MINYTALKAEIANDPNGLGYAGKTDQPVADLMNDPAKGGTITRGAITSQTVIDAVNPNEFAALTALQLQQLQVITSTGNVDVGNTNVQGQLGKLFTAAASPITRSAIIALASRPASRAEALFGSGTIIQASDVAQARLS